MNGARVAKVFRRPLFVAAMIVSTVVVVSILSCSEDNPPSGNGGKIVGPQPDTIPPAPVIDLRLRAPTHETLAAKVDSPAVVVTEAQIVVQVDLAADHLPTAVAAHDDL